MYFRKMLMYIKIVIIKSTLAIGWDLDLEIHFRNITDYKNECTIQPVICHLVSILQLLEDILGNY